MVLFFSTFALGAYAQGTLTNGWAHTGTISPVGDADSWTFSATVGDRIVIRVGEITQTGSFTPRIQLQNPGAVQIASSFGSLAAEITVTATNTGTFTVIVDDAVGTTATGTYRLTLAKAPGAVFVAPGDDGGPMTNGVMHTGTILTGDLDLWTFTAVSGDSIVLRVGEITDTNTFTPWIRLYSPSGILLGSGFGAVAGEVSTRATNSGTFIVVVGDGNGSFSGSGDYRLTLAKTGDPMVVSAGDDGGPMTNGVMHPATLLTGDLDLWSFTAVSGDSIVVRIGEITDISTFTPWIRLYSPSGILLGSGFGAVAGEVSTRATNSGTFIVVVGDGNAALSGSGDYRLTLAKTGDPVVVSAGDGGGPMTNGVMHTATLVTGDLDLWTFSAVSGDSIVVRIGEITDISTFTPWIRLYSPSGILLGSGFGAVAAEVSTRATNSGTFIVVVADGNGALSGSGDYRLTLAKTGDPVVVSAGDGGGPMTNGVMHTATLLTGDLDLWTFTAVSGDSIVVRIGEITDISTFTPWLRLYSPSGILLDSGFGSFAGEVSVRATNSGTFIVVVADGNGGLSGSGDYRLTLAKTGDPVVVSAGDDGGPMTNGVMHTATLLTGDLDLWTFTAVSGDSIVLRIGEITDTNTFTPWIRLYSPSGILLGSGFGTVAGEVATRATNSGTFIVVVGDGNGALSGSGDYRLTLVRTGSTFEVSSGDEGGPLDFGVNPEGAINVGDLDVYAFTTCKGENINLKLDELIDSGSFTPWLRLYGPNGALLASVANAVTLQINVTATNSGAFLVIISDGNAALGGTGTYRLTSNGLSYDLRLCTPIISGTNVNLGGVGGIASAPFRLYTTTNVAASFSLWTPILTNQFDSFGKFVYTNLFDKTERERYFRLQSP